MSTAVPVENSWDDLRDCVCGICVCVNTGSIAFLQKQMLTAAGAYYSPYRITQVTLSYLEVPNAKRFTT